MFGYVKPKKGELLVREYEFYRATYCGVCRAMKHYTGALSNVTLSYDSVFLALVRMLYLEDSEFKAKRRRCIAHPLSKRPMLSLNPALEYTAKAFAILTYFKAQDDLSDEGIGKRIAVRAISPIISSAKKHAAYPSLSETVKNKLDAITDLERKSHPGVDLPADYFGELLGEIFAHGLPEDDKIVPYRVGFHLGRFIYSADAAEDYDKDLESGNYNPYVLLYGGKPLSDENRQSIKCALLLECEKLSLAVNLLPFGNRGTIENIINNVIYLGLPERIAFLDHENGSASLTDAQKTGGND